MRKATVVVGNLFMSNNDQNPFDVLGIEALFEIDISALDEAYFSRQTLVHPDRFVYHSEPERQAASQQASALNHAYETVKNPLLRARALLKLRGVALPGENEKTSQNILVLEEMMDLQEALLNASSPHDLSQIEDQIRDRLKEVMSVLTIAFRQNQDEKLSEYFLRLSYLSKMMIDIKTRHRQSSVKIL